MCPMRIQDSLPRRCKISLSLSSLSLCPSLRVFECVCVDIAQIYVALTISTEQRHDAYKYAYHQPEKKYEQIRHGLPSNHHPSDSSFPTHYRRSLIRSSPPPGTAVRPWSFACCPHHPPHNLPPPPGGEKSFAIRCRLHLFRV
jgi:hypothetical protein